MGNSGLDLTIVVFGGGFDALDFGDGQAEQGIDTGIQVSFALGSGGARG